MSKKSLYRWAALVLGTGTTVLAVEGCVLQDMLNGILGSFTGL